MALIIYANTGTQDTALGTPGVEFTAIDLDNDFLLFSAGSAVVADGQIIPSETQLNSAGILLTGVEQIVPHYFLADNSAGILKEIHNMGSGNYRYVLAFDFDDETASIPVLEIWDNDDLDSYLNVSLGAGTPSSSFWRGICTTDALPGVSWVGSRLAGSSAGNYLELATAPLIGADTLYCQLKIVFPSTQVLAGSNENVIAIKYASV